MTDMAPPNSPQNHDAAKRRYERTGHYWRPFGLRRAYSGKRVYLTLWRRVDGDGYDAIIPLATLRIR